MKNINEFINEAVRRSSGKQLIDLDKFDTILDNLRKDNKNYVGVIGELTEDVSIDSYENTSVWGEYDAPVNKYFDRNPSSEIDFKKGDKVILIYNYIDRDEENGIKCLYICKYKDVWYYLNRDDADDFMKSIKVLEKK